MQILHVPGIDARYWAGITLASIFGTNLGDYYAHESGLGLIGGVPILIAIFAVAYIVERFDKVSHELYYWFAIIVIRTGATNIADYLAFRVHLNAIGLSVALALLLAFLVLRHSPLGGSSRRTGLPETNAKYWASMLTAGVFGTVLGDVCAHAIGLGPASTLLALILAVVLLAGRGGLLQSVYYYWLAIAAARTAGTAIGDWLAESEMLNIGLAASTVISGIAFVGLLLLWRGRRKTVVACAP